MKQPRASLKDPTPSLRFGAFSVLLWLLAVPLVAAQYEWTGSSGSDLFWATPANWSPAGPPEAADDARFFDPGAAGDNATVNNTVATSRSVQSLWFGQTNGFHKTLINPGTTLTISGTNAGNALLVGTETDNGSVQSVDAKIAGPGAALAVLNPTANLAVRQAGANGGSTLRATLDLSELDLFTAAVGRVLIGSESPVAPRPAGSLYLARTNALTTSGTAPTLGIGGRGGNNNGGQPSFLYLGQQNTIFANSIIVGRGKQGGGSGGSQILFNTAVFSNPEAVFRGADGTNRIASWSMADSEAVGGTVNTRGSCNFAGGKLDALVDVMFVGRSSTGTGAGTPEGFFTFDQGLLDVNTLRVGYQSISGANGARGTFNVNGTAALRVNTVLELAHVSGGAGGTLVEGTLNINGGSVWAQAVTTTSGNLTSAINVSGGTLALASLAGTPETPLSALTLGDAVLELAPLDHATNIVVATLTTASTTNNTINISSLPVITGYPVRYTLISYAVPATFDFALGTLPAGTPSFQGYLSNNVDNSTIDLVITGGPAPLQSLTWKGSPTGDWDTTTANWLVSGLPGVYRQNDSVTFDDTATGTTTVNFTTALTPHTLTVNNTTKSYTFTGTGSLSGAISLDKQGSGTLVLQNSGVNDFTGGVSISGGKLQLEIPAHGHLILDRPESPIIPPQAG